METAENDFLTFIDITLIESDFNYNAESYHVNIRTKAIKNF
jgi:hypothetical protein